MKIRNNRIEKNRKEITPDVIWNEESRNTIKDFIALHAKNQGPEQRLQNELMSIQYQIEDYLKTDTIKVKRNISEFISMYLKLLRMSQKEFAKIIEMRDSNLYKYLRGKRKLNSDIVYKISAFSHTKPELWFHLETKNSILELENDKNAIKKYKKYSYENYLFQSKKTSKKSQPK